MLFAAHTRNEVGKERRRERERDRETETDRDKETEKSNEAVIAVTDFN